MAEMDDQQLLSGLPLYFFEDDLRTDLFAISPALMEKFVNNSENFKLELVRKEQRIIDDEWLEDSEKENCSLVKESMAAKQDAHFATKFTGVKEPEVYSKGFVPKKTETNTTWAVWNFEAWLNGNKRRIQKNQCQSIARSKQSSLFKKVAVAIPNWNASQRWEKISFQHTWLSVEWTVPPSKEAEPLCS